MRGGAGSGANQTDTSARSNLRGVRVDPPAPRLLLEQREQAFAAIPLLLVDEASECGVRAADARDLPQQLVVRHIRDVPQQAVVRSPRELPLRLRLLIPPPLPLGRRRGRGDESLAAAEAGGGAGERIPLRPPLPGRRGRGDEADVGVAVGAGAERIFPVDIEADLLRRRPHRHPRAPAPAIGGEEMQIGTLWGEGNLGFGFWVWGKMGRLPRLLVLPRNLIKPKNFDGKICSRIWIYIYGNLRLFFFTRNLRLVVTRTYMWTGGLSAEPASPESDAAARANEDFLKEKC